MKDKLLLLKSDLQKLHNYDNDKVELKRIKNKLQMYINVLFPNESEDWHSMIFHINFTPPIVSYGLGNIGRGTDSGEFQQGIQQLSLRDEGGLRSSRGRSERCRVRRPGLS